MDLGMVAILLSHVWLPWKHQFHHLSHWCYQYLLFWHLLDVTVLEESGKIVKNEHGHKKIYHLPLCQWKKTKLLYNNVKKC
jgi:hypothetical protein